MLTYIGSWACIPFDLQYPQRMADRCRNMQDISACHKLQFNECIYWLIYSLFITVFTNACRTQPHVIFNGNFSIINHFTTNNST